MSRTAAPNALATARGDRPHGNSEGFDHGSDARFVDYYAAESQSSATRERFARVRDRALELLAETQERDGPFDVIDIGCGAGTQAMLWAERGHRVRALDVNEALISIARERARGRGGQAQFDVGTATALPYPDASADAVLLPELLEHVTDWETCLSEAIRVLRPRGVVYLSTTNWLCPKQQEFTLPAYAWYPPPLKRWCERKAVTTHPHWVNHARYPAIHWFSYYALSRWFAARGVRTLDRFDLLARQPLAPAAKFLVSLVRALPPLRLCAHIASEGTTVWCVREAP
jgi:2-polyprenyl-6-hydroxyphenyl methylase/3-demethylubiquinone-9 3-methyltransferase